MTITRHTMFLLLSIHVDSQWYYLSYDIISLLLLQVPNPIVYTCTCSDASSYGFPMLLLSVSHHCETNWAINWETQIRKCIRKSFSMVHSLYAIYRNSLYIHIKPENETFKASLPVGRNRGESVSYARFTANGLALEIPENFTSSTNIFTLKEFIHSKGGPHPQNQRLYLLFHHHILHNPYIPGLDGQLRILLSDDETFSTNLFARHCLANPNMGSVQILLERFQDHSIVLPPPDFQGTAQEWRRMVDLQREALLDGTDSPTKQAFRNDPIVYEAAMHLIYAHYFQYLATHGNM